MLEIYDLVLQAPVSGLLLAEGAMQTVGVGAGTLAAGVGATLAVIKWRQSQSEKRGDTQERKTESLLTNLSNIEKAIIAQGGEMKEAISNSEKQTDRKIGDMTKTVTRKVDDLKDLVAEHGTRLAVVENNQKHMGDRLDSHAEKIANVPVQS